VKKWWNAFIWYLHGYNFAWAVRVHTTAGTTDTMDFPSKGHARKIYDITEANEFMYLVELVRGGTVIEWKDLTNLKS
jgi:hypothetical protein